MSRGLDALASAVVLQALDDANPRTAATDAERHTAMLFLFGDSRGWVDSRRRWFTLAGLTVPPRGLLEKAVGSVRAE